MRPISVVMVAFGLLILVSTAQSKEWNRIRVATSDAYPPFSYITETGKLVGFDIDIANALCAEMKAKCSFITQDWDGIIPGLLARKYDTIIASMSITDSRKKRIAFTNKYYDTPARFARRKGSGIRLTKKSMDGKTVGVQLATTFDYYLTAEFSKEATVRRYRTQNDVYLDAEAGRIDLVLADVVSLGLNFLNTEQGKDWEMFGPLQVDTRYFGYGIGIAARKRDADLINKFNKAIDAIRANGVYQRINAKYFDFDVYDFKK